MNNRERCREILRRMFDSVNSEPPPDNVDSWDDEDVSDFVINYAEAYDV